MLKGLHLGRIISALQRPVASRDAEGVAPPHTDPVPVILGGTIVTQVDHTTCGAAVLLMLQATGDPELARELDEHPEKIGEYQLAIHHRIRRRAIGLLSWPQRYGSPPWTLAREARFPGVEYTARAVDDRTDNGRAILNAVWHANAAGIPVPLYTGGSLGQGLDRAIPRHVVLAVPPAGRSRERMLRIYEPSAGMLYDIPLDDLLGRTSPHRALGSWTHIVWAVMPRPTS